MMGYGLKAWTVVGYTYQAEVLCPACVVERMIAAGEASPAARDIGAEDVLDQVAGANAIDRQDESSYDSDDFPKVIFASNVEDDESCMACGESLI